MEDIQLQTLYSSAKLMDKDAQAQFNIILGLSQISGPSGYFPDVLIKEVIEYNGDVGITRREFIEYTSYIHKVWYRNGHFTSSKVMCFKCDKVISPSSGIILNHICSKGHWLRKPVSCISNTLDKYTKQLRIAHAIENYIGNYGGCGDIRGDSVKYKALDYRKWYKKGREKLHNKELKNR